MLVGYMRVSSDNDRQTTDLQRDALLDRIGKCIFPIPEVPVTQG